MTLRKRFPRFGVSRFGVLPLACYTKKVAARSYSRNSAARPGQAENHREVAMQSALRPDSSVVERGPEKAGVGGSIPSLATTPSADFPLFISKKESRLLAALVHLRASAVVWLAALKRRAVGGSIPSLGPTPSADFSLFISNPSHSKKRAGCLPRSCICAPAQWYGPRR